MKSVNDLLVDSNRQAKYLSRGANIVGKSSRKSLYNFYIKFPFGVKGLFDSISRKQRWQILQLRFMVADTCGDSAFDMDHGDQKNEIG